MRFTEDWRKLSDTLCIILAARGVIALEEAVAKFEGEELITTLSQQLIAALLDECEVDREEGVSAEASEFIYGHRKGENIRDLAETTNTLIYRQHRQDTAFHLAGRRADIDSVRSRFQQDKHIVATFYNISFIESSYGASVRYDHENDKLQIHCKPEQEYRSGKAELRLLYSKGEAQANDGSAEQAFLSAMEFLDIFELVLQGPSWLSNVIDASFISVFKSDKAYNVHTFVTTKPIDDTVLVVFAGKRNATLTVYREFRKKLKKSVVCDVFVREVAKEDSTAFLDPSLPVDGDPTDNVSRSELDETTKESYYWNRLTGRRWRLATSS